MSFGSRTPLRGLKHGGVRAQIAVDGSDGMTTAGTIFRFKTQRSREERALCVSLDDLVIISGVIMASQHLSRSPIEPSENSWYYEEPEGIKLYVKTVDGSTEIVLIPWAALRASLKRKDRKL